MIKVAGTQRMVRQTTALFESEAADGTIQTDTIIVRYYTQSAKEARDRHEAMRTAYERAIKNGDIVPFEYYMDTLAERLESLPDLCDDKGKPFAITSENLGMLSTTNLEAINKAIQEHQSPNAQPQQSPDGTSAATSQKAAA